MRKPDILSKWLHVGMASCIVLCVAFYWGGMDVHVKHLSAGLILFNLHKFVGINFIVISTIYLLWSVKKQGKPMSELFPWSNAYARECLAREVRQFGKLRSSRIVHMASGLMVFAGGVALLLGAWALGQSLAGHELAHDPILSHAHYFVPLGVAAYLAPWLVGETRIGLAREFRRLKYLCTDRIASAVQGFGVASALVAAWLGLLVVIFSIAGTTFTSDMLLPRAHMLSSFVVIGYLAVHAGAALLHGMIGHTEIFAIGKLLERTIQVPMSRLKQGQRG